MPTSTQTPVPTGSAAPTNTPIPEGLFVEIILNQEAYSSQDPFQLDLRLSNGGDSRMADLYLLLDVFGSYYFYPEWTQNIGYSNMYFSEDQILTLPILSFEVPSGIGASGPYTFYSAMFAPGTFDLSSNVAIVSFRFE
jgi:hypothetical protein